MPPWQKAQLNPPSAVVANIAAPRPTNLLRKSCTAPSCRPGSLSQYKGRPIATMKRPIRPKVRVRSSFLLSSSSSDRYGLRLGASSISEPISAREFRLLM